eukprot:scaffold499_cov129-Isochrysis_galbana.AAC.2
MVAPSVKQAPPSLAVANLTSTKSYKISRLLARLVRCGWSVSVFSPRLHPSKPCRASVLHLYAARLSVRRTLMLSVDNMKHAPSPLPSASLAEEAWGGAGPAAGG